MAVVVPNMDLRDYIAVQMLAAFWSGGAIYRPLTPEEKSLPPEKRAAIDRGLSYEKLAAMAYEQADALLEARRSVNAATLPLSIQWSPEAGDWYCPDLGLHGSQLPPATRAMLPPAPGVAA